jgi:hypothetical protein
MMTDSEVRSLLAEARATPPREPEPVAKVLAKRRAAMIAARPPGWRPTEQHEPATGGA